MEKRKLDKIISKYCCVTVCKNYKNTSPIIDLYPLPENTIEREKCCDILGIPKKIGLLPSAKVCALHFKSKQSLLQPPTFTNLTHIGTLCVNQPTAPIPVADQSPTLPEDGGRLLCKPLEPNMPMALVFNTLPQPGSSTCSTILPKSERTFSPNMMQQESPACSNLAANMDGDTENKGGKLLRSSVVTLELECEDDLLNPAQLQDYMKNFLDFINTSDIVYKLPPTAAQPTSLPLTIPSSATSTLCVNSPLSNSSSMASTHSTISPLFILNSDISKPSDSPLLIPSSVTSTPSANSVLLSPASVLLTQSADSPLVIPSSVTSTPSANSVVLSPASVLLTQSADSPLLIPSSVTSTPSANSVVLSPASVLLTQSANSPVLTPCNLESTQSTNSPVLTPSNVELTQSTNFPVLTPSNLDSTRSTYFPSLTLSSEMTAISVNSSRIASDTMSPLTDLNIQNLAQRSDPTSPTICTINVSSSLIPTCQPAIIPIALTRNLSYGANILPSPISSSQNSVSINHLSGSQITVMSPSVPPISSLVNASADPVHDKNPVSINLKPSKLSSAPCGTSSSSNIVVPQYVQISSMNRNATLVHNRNVNSAFPISGTASQPTTSTSVSYALMPNMVQQPNQSINRSSIFSMSTPNFVQIPKGQLGIRGINQVLMDVGSGSTSSHHGMSPNQFASENYKILSSVSTNAVIPVMFQNAPRAVTRFKPSNNEHLGEEIVAFKIADDPVQPRYQKATSFVELPATADNDSEDGTDVCAADLCNVVYGTLYGTSPANQVVDETSTSNKMNSDQPSRICRIDSVVSEKTPTDNKVTKLPTYSEAVNILASTSTASSSSLSSIGPVIVDVISAKEGGRDYFIGDKMPNIILDKSKKNEEGKEHLLCDEASIICPEVNKKNEDLHMYNPGDIFRSIFSDKGKKKQLVKEYRFGERIPNVLYNYKRPRTYASAINYLKSSEKDVGIVEAHSADPGKTQKLDSFVNTNENLPVEKMVKSNTPSVSVIKNSIFSLQKRIPVIANGERLYSLPIDMFQLKTPTSLKRDDEALKLREILRLENFVMHPTWWLIFKNYIPFPEPCSLCGSKLFYVDRNENYPDGYCWTCGKETCRAQEEIKRPEFFERFKTYSLQDLLLLTYHWVCQSDLKEITLDVDLNCEKIWNYFKALQELCHQVLLEKGRLGSIAWSIVETSVVKMGNVFVLGAFDRSTRYVRLDAITEEEAYMSMRHINLLENWINNSATLVSENKISVLLLPTLKKVAADPTVANSNRSEPHTINIAKFLSKNLKAIFGQANQFALKLDVIQGFLYELQWRVKYGSFIDSSFWYILNQITDLNENKAGGSNIEVRMGNLSYNASAYAMRPALSSRWVPESAATEECPLPSITNPRDKAKKTYKRSSAYDIPPKNSRDQNEKTSAAAVERRLPYITNSSYKVQKSHQKYSLPGITSKNSEAMSFSSFFQDIPEISGGSANITSRSLLAIKIRFGETPKDTDFYKSNAICLGLQLKSEGFISEPVQWLVKKGYLMNSSPCYVCQNTAYLTLNPKFIDGCSWLCQSKSCGFENMFKRPNFFARFSQYTMAHIAGMIFHWIVQSDVPLINTDIPMDPPKISHAWRSFQVLCSSALKRNRKKIGGEEVIVEVAMVQFGKIYILGALDRKSKRIRVKAFPSEINQFRKLYHTLHSWISPKSCIVMNATEQLKYNRYIDFLMVPADISITDKNDTSFHALNITSYLLKHISSMFGHIRADAIRTEVMQNYLEELMWREQFGKEPQQAFACMMKEIFRNDEQTSLDESRESENKSLWTPVTCKHLRVLLHRIPKTVLKFYGCEIADSSEPSETQEKNIVSDTTLNSVSQVSKTTENRIQCTSSRNPCIVDEDVDIITIDEEDFPDDTDSASSYNVVQNVPQETLAIEPSMAEAPVSSSSSEPFTNKVQPLVIKMHKKRKKFRSYLKSELEKVKKRELDKTLNNGISDSIFIADADLERLQSDILECPEILSSDSCQSNLWESLSHTSTDSIKSSSRKVPKRISTLQSGAHRKDEKPVCVECGDSIAMDHFMKQFNCTDCKKKSVYTTCCAKAFFEHRGSLLFGKRMPRKKKEHYGLHRPINLLYPWFCACGFKTDQGNKLATHMVKCRKGTCYDHQGAL